MEHAGQEEFDEEKIVIRPGEEFEIDDSVTELSAVVENLGEQSRYNIAFGREDDESNYLVADIEDRRTKFRAKAGSWIGSKIRVADRGDGEDKGRLPLDILKNPDKKALFAVGIIGATAVVTSVIVVVKKVKSK